MAILRKTISRLKMRNTYRCFFVGLLLLVVSLPLSAQSDNDKEGIRHEVQLSAGSFIENDNSKYEIGPALGLSYGLDIPIKNRWSIMPGVGINIQFAPLSSMYMKGGSADSMSLAELFCMLRYELPFCGITVLECGPAFMGVIINQRYDSIIGYPDYPLEGEEKFNRFDVGLRLGVTFRKGKHFQWGIGSYTGFLNMYKYYPEYGGEGTILCNNLVARVGWRF